MMTKKKQIIILTSIILVVGTLAAVMFLYLRKNIGKIETQENVSDLSRLPSWVQVPKSAANVSYCHVFLLYYGYEFDASEEEFLKWAQKWPVQKITEPTSYITFRRYIFSMPDVNDIQAFEEYELKVNPVIFDGYYYWKEGENQNGGGICVAYDKHKQRAYYSFTFR